MLDSWVDVVSKNTWDLRALTSGAPRLAGGKSLLSARQLDLDEDTSESENSEGISLKPGASGATCWQCGKRPASLSKCPKCGGKKRVACLGCASTGRFRPECRACSGSGRFRHLPCRVCKGSGRYDRECNRCEGSGRRSCPSCQGTGLPLCQQCLGERGHQRREEGPPAPGVSISRCSPGELSTLEALWKERGGSSKLEAAWVVDNPLLTHSYHQRRARLKAELGREPDELQGFHGTHPDNVLNISKAGFDSGRRSGQVFGAGEYFAKEPDVSVSYSKGGQYMFVCRLCLGHQSTSEKNLDGDHIWVPSRKYYVISEPQQILPQYIVRFSMRDSRLARCEELERVLGQQRWSTKVEQAVTYIPQNRACVMSKPSTDALWMGYLHANVSDGRLEADVRSFFVKHTPEFAVGLKVHIASGKYKKAHVQLLSKMPRELVHCLNKLPFVEDLEERFICVDDGHGSPEQDCPRWIAGYCRGRNLRFTHSCWCRHKECPTERASFRLVKVDLAGAKGTEITDKFMQSAPFHDGSNPRIVAINAIQNETLAKCHEEYRGYLRNKNKEEPVIRELYHGTNNKILDVLYKHGLQPPSDMEASEECPVSGGKGLSTSLCSNDCRHCTEPHHWNKCHMFGLGIYLADMAQKSHRYCSQPQCLPGGRRRFRMLVCSVLGRALEVAGHLKSQNAMHSVVNVRALGSDLSEMMEPFQGSLPGQHDVEGADILAVKGLGNDARNGFSVMNSEFIAYHPHQCLPKYEITYEV